MITMSVSSDQVADMSITRSLPCIREYSSVWICLEKERVVFISYLVHDQKRVGKMVRSVSPYSVL
jgi:hypothetical protein